ncbi:Anaphase-promoting complex, subunit 10, partial [Opisthorchis viverrini]
PLWSVLVEDIPDFPSLPEPTKPAVSQSTTGRASLRKSVTKATMGSMPSPSTSQNPPRTPDPVVTKTPSSTRPNKRFHPEPLHYRCQQSLDLMTLRLKALTSIDVTKDERDGKVRDVCRNAIWSLSSCKPGHGIDQLLDESTDTFWQSDGPQPHCVNIQFPQKTTLTRLCLYTDYKADESYTPS